jgi:DNA-binding CsgD family transcriptional regulator
MTESRFIQATHEPAAGAIRSNEARAKITDETTSHQRQARLCVLADTTVVSCNTAARTEAESGAILTFANGNKLQLTSASARKRLSTVIASLAARSHTRGFLQLDEGERNRGRYLIVTRAACMDALEAEATAAGPEDSYQVMVCDLTQERTLSPATLEDCLDLTPTEARLCVALVNDRSLQEFADEAGLTIATARWHWGNVREKLNVHSQVSLVRMLLRLALT